MSGVGAVSQGLTRFAESESHFGIAPGSRYIPRPEAVAFTRKMRLIIPLCTIWKLKLCQEPINLTLSITGPVWSKTKCSSEYWIGGRDDMVKSQSGQPA